MGSGYYDRRGDGQNTSSRSANGHWSRNDDNEASDVKIYRTKVCRLCLQHKPSAPMVPWIRNQEISKTKKDVTVNDIEPRNLHRSSSLGYPGTMDVLSLRSELKKMSDTIAVWRINYNRTGDDSVARYYREAEEKCAVLKKRLDERWRDSAEFSQLFKGANTFTSSDQSTPSWMPWVDDGSVAAEEGYLHIALAWAHSWDCQTRERVLIEKCYRLQDRSRLAYLPYFVTHNDWRGVVRWINNFPLAGGCVDSYGNFEVTNKDTAPPLLVSLISFVMNIIDKATYFMRELIIVEFAKRGIFLPAIFDDQSQYRFRQRSQEEVVDTGSDVNIVFARLREEEGAFVYELGQSNSSRRRTNMSNTLDFGRLMRVMCKCGLLFLEPNRIGNSLSLDALLLVGSPSPFHKYFIEFFLG